ncbi:hypothetical protein BKA62DRAFT_688555 [Auriculariales sp. MPI-PUGE-AT-0066]|nr:hypothetical protein BKA62DRAFT_688555 [Auriculariales sp. MPI-PUGE-AT-0066]
MADVDAAGLDAVHDDVDTCRICSMPSDEEHPLFYPCKCSGTIKFIHQECLTTWLEHSKKKKCDVCKHSYAFTNVYADDMPSQLPISLVFKQLSTQFVNFAVFLGRATVVSIIWLVALPYSTFLTWRTYFWFGNCWWSAARQMPGPMSPPLGAISWVFNITSLLSDNSTAAREAALTVSSTISSDIFTGQIIASLIVLVILCIFLLHDDAAVADVPLLEPVPAAVEPEVAIIPRVDDQLLPRPPTPFPEDEEDGSEDTLEEDSPVHAQEGTKTSPQMPSPARRPAPLASSSTQGHSYATPAARDSNESSQPLALVPAVVGEVRPPNSTPQRQLRFLETSLPTTPSSSESMYAARSVQDAPVTPFSAVSLQSSFDEHSGADAPHSANMAFSPAMDDESAVNLIPPFTPSAFQFTIDPAPESPSPNGSFEEISASELGQGGILSPSTESIPPFTPSALQTSHSDSSQHTTQSLAPLTPTSSDSAGPPPIPPFTPSLFNFHGASSASGSDGISSAPGSVSTSSRSGYDFGGSHRQVPETSFTFRSSDDAWPPRGIESAASPGTSSTSSSRRPGLAPATPSEEIPIALYRPPEDMPADNEQETVSPIHQQPSSSKARGQPEPMYGEMELYFRSADDNDQASSSSKVQHPRAASASPRSSSEPWASDPSDSERTEVSDIEQQDQDEFFQQEHLDRFQDDADDHDHDHDNEWIDVPDDEAMDEDAIGDAQAAIAAEGAVPALVDDQNAAALPDGEWEDLPPGADANADEDFDGVLEAVGLRGPMWQVVQNAAIAGILMDVAILLGVWCPYTIGKMMGLLSLTPRRILSLINLPIRVVRFFSDPVADACVWLVKDWFIPRVMSVLRVLVAIPADILGYRAFTAPPIPPPRPRTVEDLVQSMLQNLSMLQNIAKPTAATSALPQPTEVLRSQAFNQTYVEEALQKLPISPAYIDGVASGIVNALNRWATLVEGDTARGRIIAICMGYVVVLIAAATYVNSTNPNTGTDTARAVRREIRQQLIIVKVAIFISIELMFFPLVCGLLLIVVTSPLVPFMTWEMRSTYFWGSPVTCIFLLWLLGTTFMYQFAISLGDCRSLMREGALWFVKDPQDPAAHPIRDIMERSASSQIRKLTFSFWMYTLVIIFCVGGLVMALVGACYFLLPFRWKIREPVSEIPIDLLFVHFVLPMTFKSLRIKQNGHKAIKKWWAYTAYQLRLSSYMYGERYPVEEFTPAKWDWHMLIPGHVVEIPDDVQRDGGFLRVPANDTVPLPRDERRVIMRTDEQGNPIDPDTAAPILLAQAAEAEKAKRDHQKTGPSSTLLRTSAGVGISIPLYIGRAIIALATNREYHDVYSFFIGAYSLGGAWFIGMQIERNPRPWSLIRRVLTWAPKAAYMVLTIGVVLPILLAMTVDLYILLPIRMWLQPYQTPIISILHCWACGLIMGRMALYASRMPRRQRNRRRVQAEAQAQVEALVQVDAAAEVEVDVPADPQDDAEAAAIADADIDIAPDALPDVAVQDADHAPVAHEPGQPERVHPAPRQEDERRVMRAWYKIERHGLKDPQVFDATMEFILPVGMVLATTMAIPAVCFIAVQRLMPMEVPLRLLPQTVYVTIFAMVFGAGILTVLGDAVSAWAQGVRDEEFLVERRLRNLDGRKQ